MNPCLVRLMGPGEAQVVAHLAATDDAAHYAGVPPMRKTVQWSVNQAKRRLIEDNSWIIVAQVGELLVGFGLVAWKAEYAFIHRLFVLPEYRRGGVGSEMLKWINAYAYQKEKRELAVLIRGSNRPSGNFWIDWAFHPKSEVPEYYPDTEEAAWVLTRQVVMEEIKR